jgi:hypothetical protein
VTPGKAARSQTSSSRDITQRKMAAGTSGRRNWFVRAEPRLFEDTDFENLIPFRRCYRGILGDRIGIEK